MWQFVSYCTRLDVMDNQETFHSTVGLISPDQDLCIAQGHNVHCNPEPSHLCDSASQQGLPNQV